MANRVSHLRRRAAMVQNRGRAWSPRVMYRIPRFRWKARIKCRRRFVFVREPDESITMRRGICRTFRRVSWPAHRKAA
jgi:hypothetical protein